MTEQPPRETPSTRKRRPRARRIEAHSDTELDYAVQQAISHCARHGLDFYRVLHGIDAYVERRRREDQRRQEKIMTDAMFTVGEGLRTDPDAAP